ncbi:AAA family ATPase [Acinetobacter sp. DSM 11652]|uniref:AAA family ATPase n=1 Tax=Acinetobacter sp. DSM 11652 TaxID=346222 RepID=UPI0008B0B8BE|nr:AAA family ATPase [Acinetobacter sp. DSM 11652]SEL94343.1 Predicted ATP-binding protein involved in virulence [Acinetobacter sp. DSM 11652]
MKVQSIQLRHCYHFSDIKIKFDPTQRPISIILGDQASGKTAIIKNIYQALTWFAARAKDLRTAGVVMLDSDIKHKHIQAKIDICVQYPTDIGSIEQAATVQHNEEGLCEWQLYKTLTSKGVGHSKALTTQLEALVHLYQQAIKQDPAQGMPMVAYYPSDRFINEVNLLSKNNPAVLQTHAAYELAALPYTTFARFFEWFREISDIENARLAQVFQKIQTKQKLSSHHDQEDLVAKLLNLEAEMQLPSLKALKKAIHTLFPSISDIYIEYTPKIQLMLVQNGQEIPFSQLSNSYRQWLCLVGDIVRRLCLLNPHSIDPCLDGEGILLIDNIDAQVDEDFVQNVLSRLHEAFPQIQIIASACSELILNNEVDVQHFKLENRKIVEVEQNQIREQYDELFAQLMANDLQDDQITEVSRSTDTLDGLRLFEYFKNLSVSEKQRFIEYLQAGDLSSISSP